MNIIHITNSDYTGAGLSCVRICKSLIDIGFNSKILVLEKKGKEDFVFEYNKSKKNILYLFLIKIFRFLKIYWIKELWFENLKAKYSFWGTLPITQYDITNNQLLKEADIIHLHWINEFVDFPSFFRKMKKPIIWTQHDININYGIFHHIKQHHIHYLSLKKYEDYYLKLKTNAILQNKNIQFVTLSNEMFDNAKSNPILCKYNIFKINNSVDSNIYKPFDKTFSRKVFNIPENKTILLFVSADISDENKGLRQLVKAVQLLKNPELLICTVGLNNKEADDISGIIRLGTINDFRLLSIAYSASDYFVLPSQQEAFSQTPIEAMSCGIPVIAYPVSGTKELMNEKLGVRCNGFEVEDLVNGISQALSIKYDNEYIRQEMITRFSPKIIANKYIDVYKETLYSNKR